MNGYLPATAAQKTLVCLHLGVCTVREPQIPGVKNTHSRKTTWGNSSGNSA